jgi:hypothetical protein
MYSRLVSGFNATVVVVLFLAMAGCRSSQPDQSVSAALSNNTPQTFLETSFKVRGRDYRLCLPAELTDYAPAWNTQGGENPRLLPARAVLLARRALAKTITDAAAWSLDSVEIREIPNIDPESGLPVSTGKWYYEICFRPPNERLGTRTVISGEEIVDKVIVYRIFVLLNGTVIEPKPTVKVEPDGAANESQPSRLK